VPGLLTLLRDLLADLEAFASGLPGELAIDLSVALPLPLPVPIGGGRGPFGIPLPGLPGIMITTPGPKGPSILITTPGPKGPEILITTPGPKGPSILITTPGPKGPEILITTPGPKGPTIVTSDDGESSGNGGNGGSGEGEGGNHVPPYVDQTLEEIDRTGHGPQGPGRKGGGTFGNDGRNGGEVLPEHDADGNPISYNEWDVKDPDPVDGRGSERLVTGSDGSAYYTDDHYQTFVRIR
jgi:guanyl-specific ribonuclease Sa